MNDNLIWNLIVTTQSTNNWFDVAPNEDYLYFIPQTNSLTLWILNATDGSHVSTRTWNACSINYSYLILTVSLDSSTIYFNSFNLLCKTSVTDPNLFWVGFNGEGTPHKILALDSSQLFINIETNANLLSLVKRIDLNNVLAISKWAKQIVCSQAVDAT